ncbi:MAG: serine/threonine protein kinase [Deltaproteobacteria bacterium]|nr:serine/threonine protein kinase [Deltaproteobacteria bacterium]
MDLEAGHIISGKYRADKRLGAGAMGEVWSGVRMEDGGQVAIKALLPAAALNSEVVARFRREAQVLARVQSDYVARVLDFLSDPNFGLLLVMELVHGESMLAMLRRAGKISIEAALELGIDIARGLHDLHESRIVHRDLKPGNIVLRPNEGHMPTAILIDFGMSRILSGPDEDDEVTAITRGDRVLGTLEYIAPEQILIARSVTGAADLYALGCILYRAIAGHHVFGDAVEARLVAAKLNTEPPALPTGRNDAVSARTQALVMRLLSRRVRERYQQASDVLEEMQAIVDLGRGGQVAAHEEEEEEEMATICLPARALELATMQAMIGTVQAYQVEATPGPSPPPHPPVATVAQGWGVPPARVPTVQLGPMPVERRQADWRWFVVAVGIAMICGGLVGWLIFLQVQGRGWLSGASPSPSTSAAVLPAR